MKPPRFFYYAIIITRFFLIIKFSLEKQKILD
nr:MAG TPA: hypothetical protein [Caudoviricetes sp.]